ncbi:hypothetical protein B0H14DRAFT_3875864 [Mycena olivaceomarginata]|nr:hypothetical protein B0H14DRAFT_3875864 [Mycena olivaceomarginata]
MQGATPAFSPIRTTRSGAQFSPNELDSLTLNGVTFGVIHTNISLDRLLQEALVATDRRAADLDAGGEVGGEDEDEWEDEVDLESRPPHPTLRHLIAAFLPSLFTICVSSAHTYTVLTIRASSAHPDTVPNPNGLLSGTDHHRRQHRETADPKLIVDSEGRIIAILLGQPDDPDWENVVKEAAKALRHARCSARRAGVWFPGSSHRRGTYYSITAGASFGGGQRRPGNLRNSRKTRKILLKLLCNPYVRRIVGFQSSGFALVYSNTTPTLLHLFTNSVFPSVTFNCGPDAFTFDHCDFLNLSHGLCGITSGGKYNHKRGGHLYLKQLHLVIEFPSSASMLIPSGCVDYGNTPIQPDETRHSITQYAAGGLFRWAAYGYKSAKDLLAKAGGKAVKDAFDGVPGSRWEWALGLFSKLDELEADRTTAFASPV